MLALQRRFLSSTAQQSKFQFYDLVRHSNRRPHTTPTTYTNKEDDQSAKSGKSETLQATQNAENAETAETAEELKKKAAEAKIAKVFGGRIKGEDRQSSSRINVGQARLIAGIKVPDRPKEPDNCCMSGCINCVWEIYNDDVKDWNVQRRKAAEILCQKGGVWPEDFHPPVKYLKNENLPKSLRSSKRHPEKHQQDRDKEEAWDNVPVQIKAFAEMEKRIKSRRKNKTA